MDFFGGNKKCYFTISKSYENENEENYFFGVINNSDKKISKIILNKINDDNLHELNIINSHSFLNEGEIKIYHALTKGLSSEPCGSLEIIYEDNITHIIKNIMPDDKIT